MGTSVLLVSAVLVSLAAGVMVAYTICVAMFAVFNRKSGIRSAQIAVSSPLAD